KLGDRSARIALREEYACLVRGVERLLVPAAELRPPEVELDRPLRIAERAARLREVEDRPRRIRVIGEVALEQLEVALQLHVARASVHVVRDRPLGERLARVGPVAGEVLVGPALEAPVEAASEQAVDGVGEVALVPDQVRVRLEL